MSLPKPNWKTEAVRKLVAALFPASSALAAIPGGEESQVFRFTCDHRNLILRLSRSPDSFEKDRFAFERFARPGLPIQRVFQTGKFDGCFYCVSQQLPGRTLQELATEQITDLLLPTHRVWQMIAKSDLAGLSGFGPFDRQGVTTFPTWHAFLVDIIETIYEGLNEMERYIDIQVVKSWANTFSRLTASCPEERALVHGDFGSNNILAEHDVITGVLDWSEAMIGDPLYDIANISFWRTWLPCMEQQARYSESHLGGIANGKERLLCYGLRIGLNEFFTGARLGNCEIVNWSLERCRQIMSMIPEEIRR